MSYSYKEPMQRLIKNIGSNRLGVSLIAALFIFLLFLIPPSISACENDSCPSPTQKVPTPTTVSCHSCVTSTPKPTYKPKPTFTPYPTKHPSITPTQTPGPTATPEPTITSTPTPTPTSSPSTTTINNTNTNTNTINNNPPPSEPPVVKVLGFPQTGFKPKNPLLDIALSSSMVGLLSFSLMLIRRNHDSHNE